MPWEWPGVIYLFGFNWLSQSPGPTSPRWHSLIYTCGPFGPSWSLGQFGDSSLETRSLSLVLPVPLNPPELQCHVSPSPAAF